jgi:phage-related protein
MPVAAGISAAGALGSAGLGLFGSLTASNQQTSALKQGYATLQNMFNTAYGGINPVIQTGLGAANSVLPTLQALLTPGSSMTQTLSQIPGFQFAQNWGQKAVQNLGTTTGLGGNVLTSGAQFATGLAQQGYSGIVNLLQNLFSSGGQIASSGASALGSTAGNFGNSMASILGQTGQAQAAGTLGATNALSSGLTGGTSAVSNYMLLSKLFPGLSSSGAGASAGGTGIYSGASVPPVTGGIS